MKSTITTRFLLFFLAFNYLLTGNAQDTFSIVAVDQETGEIGSAGASCVDGAASIGGVIIISGIIPGRGAINGQATICIPHTNLDYAIGQMNTGKSPQEILDLLYANDQCQFGSNETRQYGIVDFDPDGNPRSAGFTGLDAFDWKGHIVGDNYAIQGNILLDDTILAQMEANFNSTSGSLAEKLMAALQGANVPGADSRCLNRGTSSTSAFLRVFKPDDDVNNPFLEINVAEMPFGEEPIDSVQTLFDEWFVTSTNEVSIGKLVKIFPNPALDHFTISLNEKIGTEPLDLTVYTITGKEMVNQRLTETNTKIDLDTKMQNLLIVKITNQNGEIEYTGKIIIQ